MVGKGHPVTIGLNAFISLPVDSWRAFDDKGQQSARRVSLNDVWIYPVNEIMMISIFRYSSFEGDADFICLYPVQGLTILTGRLPAYTVAYARSSHQVAFIRGIDKHPAIKTPAAFHCN